MTYRLTLVHWESNGIWGLAQTTVMKVCRKRKLSRHYSNMIKLIFESIDILENKSIKSSDTMLSELSMN